MKRQKVALWVAKRRPTMRDRWRGRPKPRRWIENVVKYSVLPHERREYGLDLRRTFRRKVLTSGQAKADRFARGEALKWLLIWWPLRISQWMLRLVRFVSG